MSTLQRLCRYVLLLFLFHIGVDAVSQGQGKTGGQAKAAQPIYQGSCGTFVSQCYKTCFGLGQVRVAYACSLSNGIYTAHCGCGSTDETNVVLSLAGIPNTVVTTTLHTTATKVVVLTATSTASTATTAISTFQTSVCSYVTIASTVLVTSTITAQPTTVTSFTTVTATKAAVYTSSVPAVVVSSGLVSTRKRSNSNVFCSDIQIACTVGCAASWSTPAVQYCQANAQTTQYSIACICKNNVNVVQQVIQAFNLLRPAAQKCTSIATTKVAATMTATATSVATALVTSRVTVVPTTVVSVYTSVVTATSTYACYTTISTTSIITNVATPTMITTVSSTTVVTAVVPSLYHVSVTVSGQAGPSYVAQSLNSYGFATVVDTTESAQTFAILQDTSSDTLYNLVGVGAGDFQGYSLGAESADPHYDPTTNDIFKVFLEALGTQPQEDASYSFVGNYFSFPAETAIWQVDLVTLAMQMVWTSPSGSSPTTTILEGWLDSIIYNALGAYSDFEAGTAYYSYTDTEYTAANFALVSV